MYRVNAERSQEKNERTRSAQRCTKVTVRASCNKKSSPRNQDGVTGDAHAEESCSTSEAGTKKKVRFNRAAWRTNYAKRRQAWAIYNRGVLQAKNGVKERIYGWFE
jgi:hypothetical protein